jgi:hypothetical protein
MPIKQGLPMGGKEKKSYYISIGYEWNAMNRKYLGGERGGFSRKIRAYA